MKIYLASYLASYSYTCKSHSDLYFNFIVLHDEAKSLELATMLTCAIGKMHASLTAL